MSGFDHAIRNTLAQILGHVRRDPALSAELVAARAEFFGEGVPAPSHGDTTAASGRFGEWFLLERQSPVTGITPIESYRASVGAGLSGQEARAADLLEQSIVGVFLVRSQQDRMLQVEDLLGRRDLSLRRPEGSKLVAGDTLVGRLFPDGAGTWHGSEALSVQRGPDLAEAFRRDVARNLSRGILSRRLSQLELEGILWGRAQARTDSGETAGDAGDPQRLTRDLAALLGEGNLDELDAEDVSEQLRAASRPGPVIGPILERVAFHSDADLDRLQRALLELWNAWHPTGSGASPAESEEKPASPSPDGPCPCGSRRPYAACCLGKHAAARIEEGLARGDDVEALFAEVEAMVGGEEAEDEAPEELDALEEQLGEASAAEGDLTAFLQEYAWETTLDARDAAARPAIEALIAFLAELAPPVRSVDFVSLDHVRAFALRQHLEAPPGCGAERVAVVLHPCAQFFGWVRSEQLLPAPDVGALAAELAPALARADRVARSVGETLAVAAADAAPAVLEVTAVGVNAVELAPRGRGVVGPRGHRVPARVRTPVPAGLSSEIRPGDLWIGPVDAAGRWAAPIRVVAQEIADQLTA